MKRLDPAVIVGLALILLGGLFALQQLDIIEDVGDTFFGAAFLIGGLFFLIAYFTGSWWGAIPGCTLAGIGALILLPDSLEEFGGAVFLGGVALAFWLVYLSARVERWWALIPAGVLTTLAFVSFAPQFVSGEATGGIFFLGLALTFALVAWLAHMRWAWIPAAVLCALGLVVMLAAGDVGAYLWAAVLIGAGGWLIYRYFKQNG
ncbi:MAG: hypothetical protein AB1750_10545 [Chloroflexota bacterium]